MTPHHPSPGIHLGDYITCEKYLTGSWTVNLTKGEIYYRHSGKPVPFCKNRDGYLIATVRCKGIQTRILKHRAIWIIANIRHGLPLDTTLEVDHINHIRTDCRIQNLRLVTRLENLRAKPGAIPPETVRAIRKRYYAGGITQKKLAEKYQISEYAVSRIIRWISYTEVTSHD